VDGAEWRKTNFLQCRRTAVEAPRLRRPRHHPPASSLGKLFFGTEVTQIHKHRLWRTNETDEAILSFKPSHVSSHKKGAIKNYLSGAELMELLGDDSPE